MCTNYNAAAAPFQDKGVMMEYAHAQSCKVTEHMVHGVECDPHKNAGSAILYTRNNPVIQNQDIKTYDLGLFQIAIANSPPAYANLPIGELWVQYTVKIRKPKLFSTRGLDVNKDAFYQSTTNGTTGMTISNWFGTNGPVMSAQQNNIGCLIEPSKTYAYTGTTNPAQTSTSGSGCSITIPAGFNGNLRISCWITGPVTWSLVTNTINVVLLGNINLIFDLYGAGAEPSAILTSFSTNEQYLYFVVDVYVRQATGIAYNPSLVQPNGSNYSGGNNIISLSGLPSTTGSNAVTAAYLTVEQYQPLGGLQGLTTSNNRVSFVNAAGNIVYPLP